MDKKQKLLNRPKDDDTKILMEDLVDFGDFPGLMELWNWDGITASSVILLAEDVAHLSQDDLVKYVFQKMKQPIDRNHTFKIALDYVYINFNFKVKD